MNKFINNRVEVNLKIFNGEQLMKDENENICTDKKALAVNEDNNEYSYLKKFEIDV